MTPRRPVNLNLFTIKFPLPAIISILHRITGVILFLAIPCFLWLLSFSLTQDGFAYLSVQFDKFYLKFFVWLFLIAFIFHFIAGLRHLLMDIHLGTSLKTGRMTAVLTLVVVILLTIFAGICLW